MSKNRHDRIKTFLKMRYSRALADVHADMEFLVEELEKATAAAPEVVTEDEYLDGFIASLTPDDTAPLTKGCAVYNFLKDSHSRHTRHMMKKHPNGVKIVKTDKGEG